MRRAHRGDETPQRPSASPDILSRSERDDRPPRQGQFWRTAEDTLHKGETLGIVAILVISTTPLYAQRRSGRAFRVGGRTNSKAIGSSL
jgi:hypothetical protein